VKVNTLLSSTRRVNITITPVFCSQIILQKSRTVSASGPLKKSISANNYYRFVPRDYIFANKKAYARDQRSHDFIHQMKLRVCIIRYHISSSLRLPSSLSITGGFAFGHVQKRVLVYKVFFLTSAIFWMRRL